MTGIACPLSAPEVLDEYFLENRARVLELAAFLDRLGRSRDAGVAAGDPRLLALRAALKALDEAGPAPGAAPELARRVQLCFSDPTAEPIASAAGQKGARGAWMGGGR